MGNNKYIKLTDNQVEKVGNSIIYLSEKISNLSKTKALKLIYILDELSIKKSGIPFFNLKYKVWKFGPVSEEIYIDLSSRTHILKDYIERVVVNDHNILRPISTFVDDEFSDNDIDLLDYVIDKFGSDTAKELVKYTHREKSPWHISADENGVLNLLENEEINNTEILVNMASLIEFDERKKMIYQDYIESH
ncbi:MAG: Panacea domain-containing protein [Flavobacteriales bacterium]